MQKNANFDAKNGQNFDVFEQKSDENLNENISNYDKKSTENDVKNMQKNANFDANFDEKNAKKSIDFDKKNDVFDLENYQLNAEFEDVFEQNFEQKSDENFKVSATKIVAKILKYLRENNFHLLSSVYSELQSAKIVENQLEISFIGENFKEILQNRANIDIINDIIKTDNLKISYNFALKEKEQDVVKILKNKFKEIEIKE